MISNLVGNENRMTFHFLRWQIEFSIIYKSEWTARTRRENQLGVDIKAGIQR